MSLTWWARLRLGSLGRWGRRASGRGPCRRAVACPLSLEVLEDRTTPTSPGLGTVCPPTFPDSAGPPPGPSGPATFSDGGPPASSAPAGPGTAHDAPPVSSANPAPFGPPGVAGPLPGP